MKTKVGKTFKILNNKILKIIRNNKISKIMYQFQSQSLNQSQKIRRNQKNNRI